MRRRTQALGVGLGCSVAPSAGFAHGFGQRIDLPIPLELFLVGAGVAVAASFLLIGYVPARAAQAFGHVRCDLYRLHWFRSLAQNALLGWVINIAFIALAGFLVTAGFVGNQTAPFNIAPTFVWILFGVGMLFVAAFIGDVWRRINPWRNVHRIAEMLAGRKLTPRLLWPERLGVWPAFALFFLWRWLENVYWESARPATLAAMILFYTLLMFSGMCVFGREVWLKSGDPFSVLFRLLSSFAITTSSVVDGRRRLDLRLPAVGLIDQPRANVSTTVFVIFMLAGIAFDGIKAGPLWIGLVRREWLPAALIDTLGLAGLLLMFLAAYLCCVAVSRALAGSHERVIALGGEFAHALLPIAIAYEVAHYASLLLIEGQRAIYLVSDPLGHGYGLGWNLFGTAGYAIDYEIVNLRRLWYWQVGLIVGGHIIAVAVTHLRALQLFAEASTAKRSQWPMLTLMVGYTVFSLWTLAQPIVAGAG